MDAIIEELEKAGLVEAYTDAEGREAYRLTRKGQAVLDALLDEQEA